MSPTLATVVSILSAIVAVGSFLLNGRVSWRKDVREQVAADDAEAARLIALKDERILELEQKVGRLQNDFDALAAKVRELEKKLDEYGCWNGPKCKNRKPLSGPRPEATVI